MSQDNVIGKPATSEWKLVKNNPLPKDGRDILVLSKSCVRDGNVYTGVSLVRWTVYGCENKYKWYDEVGRHHPEDSIIAWAEVNIGGKVCIIQKTA